MTRPYENLINAIILQAVKDYRDALKRLKKKPQNTDAMSTCLLYTSPLPGNLGDPETRAVSWQMHVP